MEWGCPAVAYCVSGTSKQVKINSTPGTFMASSISIDLTIPFAMVLRTNRTSKESLGIKSSVYLA